MRTLLMTLSGIGLSLVMFVGGLVAATAYFQAEPERQLSLVTDETGVWTDQPVKVDAASQTFERIPAQPVAQQLLPKTPPQGAPATVNDAQREVASLSVQGQPQDQTMSETNSAHVEWCSERYRSYRADDNSYTSYSGGRRECVSPYTGSEDASSGIPFPGSPEEYALVDASFQPASGRLEIGYYGEQAPTSDHVEYCFSRYRSYRPEDNSYQPYDGGARKQCH